MADRIPLTMCTAPLLDSDCQTTMHVPLPHTEMTECVSSSSLKVFHFLLLTIVCFGLCVCRITIVQQHANQAGGQQLSDVMKLIMGNYSSHQMSRNLSHKMSPVKALHTLTVKPPANGKLHQTRKLAATAAAQSVVETGFQLQISRDKIHFRFLLLLFFFSFCCCCSCCCCALCTWPKPAPVCCCKLQQLRTTVS